jgi:hypothetical protein
MSNLNKKKFMKIILFSIIVFFSLIFLIKFSLNFVENKITSTLKSKNFEIFLMNEFNNKLENFANKSVSEGEYIFYRDNFYKIFKKYKPIFDEIEIDDIMNNSDLNKNQLRDKLEEIYFEHRIIFLDIEQDIEK